MQWSGQQRTVLNEVGRWVDGVYSEDEQIKRVDGYAGTGKTTLAKYLVNNADGQWLYAAFTGKAALVMRQKGCHGARTIHSLIYRPNGEKKDHNVVDLEHQLAIAKDEEQKVLATLPALPEKDPTNGVDFSVIGADFERKKDPAFIAAHARVAELEERLRRAKLNERRQPAYQLWDESPLKYASGLVLDEGSMVDEEVARDLMSFNKKILVLMDPAQLPPVGSPGYFSTLRADHLLTEVHRQARESGILDLATFVREGGDVRHRAAERWSTHDCTTGLTGDMSDLRDRVMSADQVIVGMNRTRHAFNARQRELRGRKTPWPEASDKLICLRNDKNSGLMNGGMWIVRSAVRCEEDKTIGIEMTPDDASLDVEPTVVSSWEHHFVGREAQLREMGYRRNDEQELDYGYAITAHKSQGSQWNSVVVFDESRAFRGVEMQRRWLYTAITRAAQKLTVVV